MKINNTLSILLIFFIYDLQLNASQENMALMQAMPKKNFFFISQYQNIMRGDSFTYKNYGDIYGQKDVFFKWFDVARKMAFDKRKELLIKEKEKSAQLSKIEAGQKKALIEVLKNIDDPALSPSIKVLFRKIGKIYLTDTERIHYTLFLKAIDREIIRFQKINSTENCIDTPRACAIKAKKIRLSVMEKRIDRLNRSINLLHWQEEYFKKVVRQDERVELMQEISRFFGIQHQEINTINRDSVINGLEKDIKKAIVEINARLDDDLKEDIAYHINFLENFKALFNENVHFNTDLFKSFLREKYFFNNINSSRSFAIVKTFPDDLAISDVLLEKIEEFCLEYLCTKNFSNQTGVLRKICINDSLKAVKKDHSLKSWEKIDDFYSEIHQRIIGANKFKKAIEELPLPYRELLDVPDKILIEYVNKAYRTKDYYTIADWKSDVKDGSQHEYGLDLKKAIIALAFVVGKTGWTDYEWDNISFYNGRFYFIDTQYLPELFSDKVSDNFEKNKVIYDTYSNRQTPFSLYKAYNFFKKIETLDLSEDNYFIDLINIRYITKEHLIEYMNKHTKICKDYKCVKPMS